MSERKGPRPVAWEGWHATITGEKPLGALPGFVDVQEYEADEPGRDYSMTPAEAEAHGLALIMAAVVARGERGHTAALNRVAAALGREAPADEFPGLVRDAVADLRAVLCDVDGATMADYIGQQAPWWVIARAAGILRVRADLAAERDTARAALAALREDLAAAEAARAEAAQEAARLRVELGEAREALAGKTMHDAAGEVVAPLREALKFGSLDPSTLSPAEVVSHTLFRLGLREGAKPAREPMTHTSLASIELHGVVVGDRITLASDASWARVGNIISNEGLLMSWSAAGAMRGAAFKSAVVEAPDAD